MGRVELDRGQPAVGDDVILASTPTIRYTISTDNSTAIGPLASLTLNGSTSGRTEIYSNNPNVLSVDRLVIGGTSGAAAGSVSMQTRSPSLTPVE